MNSIKKITLSIFFEKNLSEWILKLLIKAVRYANAQKAEAEFRKLLAQRAKDAKEKKKERRRSSLSKSKTSVSSN